MQVRRGKSLTGSKPRQGMLRQSAKQEVIAKLTHGGNASERGETRRVKGNCRTELLPRATSADDLHSENRGRQEERRKARPMPGPADAEKAARQQRGVQHK